LGTTDPAARSTPAAVVAAAARWDAASAAAVRPEVVTPVGDGGLVVAIVDDQKENIFN
jgi:hypothetical protein